MIVFIPSTVFAETKINTTELDSYLKDQTSNNYIPDGILSIIQNGNIDYKWSTENTNTHSIFFLGTSSRIFTDIALLQIKESGRINIKRPITDFIPWFLYKDTRKTVSLEDVILHKEGISEETLNALPILSPKSNDLQIFESSLSTETKPFSNPQRSAVATQIALNLIVKNYSNLDYPTYIQKRIFNPMAFTDSSVKYTDVKDKLILGSIPNIVNIQNENLFDSNFGKDFVFTSTNDLNHLLNALGNDTGTYLGNPILNKDDITLINNAWKVKKLANNEPFNIYTGASTSYFNTFAYYPKKNIYIVFLTNFNSPSIDISSSQENIVENILNKIEGSSNIYSSFWNTRTIYILLVITLLLEIFSVYLLKDWNLKFEESLTKELHLALNILATIIHLIVFIFFTEKLIKLYFASLLFISLDVSLLYFTILSLASINFTTRYIFISHIEKEHEILIRVININKEKFLIRFNNIKNKFHKIFNK